MSITIDKVSKSFGHDEVLQALSLEVPTGSFTALLGPSGSGKSTLLRLIAGLTKVDSGRIWLNGQDVTDVPVRERQIGFCFQNYAPFRHLTVEKNIAYGLKVQRRGRREIATKVEELLSLVQLTNFATRYPHQLSGGQAQRMALARALAIEPRVLLLDEPFAALDAQVRGEVRTWVRSLQHELGITTILVTHDQQEAMEVADTLVLLNKGTIEQVGPPAQMYDAPDTEFVRSFLGPLTTFEGVSLRPHELELVPEAASSGQIVTITDVVRLGFEVRVIVDDGSDSSTWIQLTHDEALLGNYAPGQRVRLRIRRESHA
jgi:sulfate transport system ATP-binding protein